jgi:hypothetical protein
MNENGQSAGVGGSSPDGRTRPKRFPRWNIMSVKSAILTASLVLGFFAGPALAQDITYRLTNSTSMALVEFYTSPVDEDDWEDDLLGDDILDSGETGIVVIVDGRTQCEYDLLFVMEDGSEYVDTVDICQLASYELTD